MHDRHRLSVACCSCSPGLSPSVCTWTGERAQVYGAHTAQHGLECTVGRSTTWYAVPCGDSTLTRPRCSRRTRHSGFRTQDRGERGVTGDIYPWEWRPSLSVQIKSDWAGWLHGYRGGHVVCRSCGLRAALANIQPLPASVDVLGPPHSKRGSCGASG